MVLKNECQTDGKQGLKIAIEEFLETNTQWELFDVYKNNHGLSVLKKGNYTDSRITKYSQWD